MGRAGRKIKRFFGKVWGGIKKGAKFIGKTGLKLVEHVAPVAGGVIGSVVPGVGTVAGAAAGAAAGKIAGGINKAIGNN